MVLVSSNADETGYIVGDVHAENTLGLLVSFMKCQKPHFNYYLVVKSFYCKLGNSVSDALSNTFYVNNTNIIYT